MSKVTLRVERVCFHSFLTPRGIGDRGMGSGNPIGTSPPIDIGNSTSGRPWGCTLLLHVEIGIFTQHAIGTLVGTLVGKFH
jgi:hypothetical protein